MQKQVIGGGSLHYYSFQAEIQGEEPLAQASALGAHKFRDSKLLKITLMEGTSSQNY